MMIAVDGSRSRFLAQLHRDTAAGTATDGFAASAETPSGSTGAGCSSDPAPGTPRDRDGADRDGRDGRHAGRA
eukprot:4812408-Prymnesium_polylepis.1